MLINKVSLTKKMVYQQSIMVRADLKYELDKIKKKKKLSSINEVLKFLLEKK